MTTSSAATDENFVKMTFLFQWIPLCRPGARPTNDISIESEIRSKFGVFWFETCMTDHNEILNTQRQLHCHNVCIISLWSAEYLMNKSTI